MEKHKTVFETSLGFLKKGKTVEENKIVYQTLLAFLQKYLECIRNDLRMCPHNLPQELLIGFLTTESGNSYYIGLVTLKKGLDTEDLGSILSEKQVADLKTKISTPAGRVSLFSN